MLLRFMLDTRTSFQEPLTTLDNQTGEKKESRYAFSEVHTAKTSILFTTHKRRYTMVLALIAFITHCMNLSRFFPKFFDNTIYRRVS